MIPEGGSLLSLTPGRRGQPDLWGKVAFYTSLGFIVPGSALAGYLLGGLGDRRLGTTPALGLAGGLVGAAAGIFEVVRLLLRAEKRDDGSDSGTGTGAS